MSVPGRSPQGTWRDSCYVCGGDGTRRERVPSAWLYVSSDGPADWPTAPICRRCVGEREAGDSALRAFVATCVAAGGDAQASWAETPRAVRDGIDRLVRGLHHVLLGECAPAATTVVMAQPPAGELAGAEAFDVGADFRVLHASVRLHHRWRITFFGAVTFYVVTCPPLSDALRTIGQEADQSRFLARG
jgi:hypothetical protein